MSHEKINKILNTYRPVEGKPGYVWVVPGYTCVKLEVLREAYYEYFTEGVSEISRDKQKGHDNEN